MRYTQDVSNEPDVVAMLRGLAHPVRLGIMRELAERPETCACDFTELFSVSQPTISIHLKVLREAGLVHTRRRGNQICYSIDPEAVRRIEAVIAGLTTAQVGAIA
jgi:ArsR family transcriptional regulator, arsenate/arsenite/antimonite-responsive transcriptional repressor